MKRILYIAALTASAFLASCSGQIDDADHTQDIPDEYTAPFTLSADKTQVEADGKETVSFSLKDAYGREMLTDRKALQNVNIVSDRGVRVPRMGVNATFIDNGVYKFTATYLGTACDNVIDVTAVNRAKYEVFHRNVGLFKATSVWCSACPMLAQSLHGLSADAKNHSVVLACHGDFKYSDPFAVRLGETDLGGYILGFFKTDAWPTLIYDLDVAEAGAAGTSTLESNIYQRRVNHPATCGIKVSSVQIDGSSLKVSASLKTSTGGSYDLACAVLCDGLEYDAQGVYSANNDGIYDEVVMTITSNFLRYSPETGETLGENAEMEREFTFTFGEMPSVDVLNKLYVAVWAHRTTGDSSIMDNIVTCPYGKSVDYRYNE